MNIKNYLYQIRKRVDDKTLLNLKSIIDNELERRTLSEETNPTGVIGK